MGLDYKFWNKRKVLLTGHTGFKGSWMTLLLNTLGADVHGISLKPATKPNMFEALNIGKVINSNICDIRDEINLNKIVQEINPEIVIHMAAQPLVRESYLDPLYTYNVNVMGTANLLSSLINIKPECILNVTTDKVYHNNNWIWGYRELDKLGGYDPYSSSKACSEIITESFYKSFYSQTNTKIFTARSGNVFGGGDWSSDRLVPDMVISSMNNKKLIIRNPNSTRPWQHVLEPLLGYLLLIQFSANKKSKELGLGWNFGPSTHQEHTVDYFVKIFKRKWPKFEYKVEHVENIMHEAELLKLDSSKAYRYLNWKSLLSFDQSIDLTIDWYKKFYNNSDMYKYTNDQINNFLRQCNQ